MGELRVQRNQTRPIAIKILRSDVEADAQRRRRFEEEAKAVTVRLPSVPSTTFAPTSTALTLQLRESGSWNFGVAGDLATACALVGAHDEALEFLGNAIDLGWIHADFFAKHDRSFEKLWGDERFERLMARARQKFAAFKE